MWSYIVFATRARHSGVAAFLTKLRRLGVAYDPEYGVRKMRNAGTVIMAEMTEGQYDEVESFPEVLRITSMDPFVSPDDPLSGCEEEGDPDD